MPEPPEFPKLRSSRLPWGRKWKQLGVAFVIVLWIASIGHAQSPNDSKTLEASARDIVLSGVVFPLREIEVPAPVTGQLETVHVSENALVAEETVLAQVNDQQARTAKALAEYAAVSPTLRSIKCARPPCIQARTRQRPLNAALESGEYRRPLSLDAC